MELNINEMLLLSMLKNNPHAISIVRKLHSDIGELLLDETKTAKERLTTALDKLNAFAENFT